MTYRAGLLILTFTVLLSSLNGVMMRLAQDPEPWPAVVGRYLAQAAGMTLYIAWRSRGRLGARFVAMGLPGIVTSVCYGLVTVGFLVALSLTTVAETMFVLSAMPVVTAIAARLLLGERVRRSAWIAMAGSALGIAVMFGDNAGNGGSTAGLLVAIVCVLFMAGFGVGLRWGRTLDMMPTIVVGSLIAGLIGLAVEPTALTTMSRHDLLLFAAWGGLLATVFSVTFVLASRVVPGGEMMLFIFVEAVLSPFWVWLVVGEVPAAGTFTGGAIVLASLAVFAAAGLRRSRPVVPGAVP